WEKPALPQGHDAAETPATFCPKVYLYSEYALTWKAPVKQAQLTGRSAFGIGLLQRIQGYFWEKSALPQGHEAAETPATFCPKVYLYSEYAVTWKALPQRSQLTGRSA